ncbi:fungal-specific transcription factor domain-containing protein [Talaromyces proteolyticus]|uniref:Fungal-specific transcription factor domain-containing protein n=1 Tax=Talaromyces proteolyticus TaxID=1131652 RepID=A0AAD4L1L5_9EURO|nr:fungal-specific transcription factor domain-containing protein [Talaromyces proteolyticus]KAH8703860.1 fungal-specific transcription factor domain-containing protein [Talaromyces proteolyticus]
MQTQACDRCHRRKTKCDRRVPRCSSCEKANTPCVHTNKLNLLPYPRSYINSLEATIKQLDTENKKLNNELKTLRSSQALSPHSTPASPIADENTFHCDGRPPSSDSNAATTASAISSDGIQLPPSTPEERRQPGSRDDVQLFSIVYSLVAAKNLPSPQKAQFQQDEDSLMACSSLLTLPSREEAARVIEAYFYHWHLTFPLLCRSQFLKTVERIYSEEEYYTKNPFEAFVFDMVLGMGSVNFNRPDWSSNSPERHYIRAISKLDKVLSMKDLPPLQAIIFLCQYSIFCSLQDTSANMWYLVGIAVRLCMEMGLHRRSRQEESVAQGLEAGKISLAVEVRKRTFWCLYNLDRIISVTLGRPVALRDEDIDITLPTAFDIDNLSLEELTQEVVVTENLQKTSPFLHLISIRRLAGKILQSFHCTTMNVKLSREERYEIQQSLYQDLQAWRAEIPNIDILSQMDERSTSGFRSMSWYEIPYHNALLLFYRPSPSFPHTRPPCDNVTEDPLITLNNILASSTSAIYLYSEQHRTRRLNYSWITLHAVFIAGLSYVYSISRIIKETKRRGTSFPANLEYTQIIDVTRTCSNVLVAINERWATARGSVEIFSHLSNAIIQDAVKAQLNVHKPGPSSSPSNYNAQRYHTPVNASDPSFGSEHIQPAAQSGQSHPHHQQDTLMANFPNSYLGMKLPMANNNIIYPSTTESFQSSIAENGFRQFYNSLHGEVPGNLRDPGLIPSEVVMGFSQDWFAGESMSSAQSPGARMDATDLWEIMGLVPSANQFE